MYARLRTVLAAVTVPLAVATVSCPAAGAITPPAVDARAVPPPGAAGPVQPMAQRNPCVATGVLPGTTPGALSSDQSMLNLAGAWKYSRGDGLEFDIRHDDHGARRFSCGQCGAIEIRHRGLRI